MTTIFLRGWRLLRTNPTLFARRFAFLMRSPVRNFGEILGVSRRSVLVQESYDDWLACMREADPAPEGPLLSVLMPVFNVEAPLLEAAIRSVLEQTYRRWELCIADDASTQPHIRRILEHYTATDNRIRVVYRPRQGHISAASNSAIEIATGDFVVLLDHDDVLTPDALGEVARASVQDPSIDLIYSDEDKLDPDGRRVEPFFKPAWSPTLLRTCNYITHLAALRRSLVLEVGGFRDEVVGSQDHDLFLRVGERARAVSHIPLVLYSWRKTHESTATASSAKPYAIEAGRRALQDAIERSGRPARLEPSDLNGIFYMRERAPRAVSVSLVVMGDGDPWRALLGLPGVHIEDVVRLRARHARRAGDPAEAESIDATRGEYLLWVDAFAQPADSDAVLALAEQASRPDVAMAGGMTSRRSTRTVLQAGLAIGDGGQPHYAYGGLSRLPQRNFYLNLKDLPREVSAVHAGCCMIRRDRFEVLGGVNGALPPALAVVDLCLRAPGRGYVTIYTPLADYRTERPLPEIPPVNTVQWDWHDYIDPYWNPNLTPTTNDGLPFRCTGARQARLIRCGDPDARRP